MRFHTVSNITLLMLFCNGIILPTTRKLVNNKIAIVFSRIWGWIFIFAFPLFGLSLSLPLVFPDATTTERVFSILAGMSSCSNVFKLYSFIYNIPRFERLIKLWDEFMDGDFYPELRKELLLRRKKTTDRWAIGFGIVVIFVFFMTGLIPFYTRKVEHPTAIPYSKKTPQFEILIIFELILTVSLCFFVHSYNCFLMQLVAFEDALCDYLSHSLRSMLTSLKVTNDGAVILLKKNLFAGEEDISSMRNLMSYREICGLTENKMREWISLHQQLLRFHDIMREIYGIPLSVEFAGLVLLICLVVLMFVSGTLTPAMISSFTVYCGNIYTIFYVTCFYGDLAELSSENLFRDSFGENWFVYSRKIRVAYQLIILRCKRPINLMAFNMYPLNSRSFATIFRHSYSFLMFLIQVTNRSKHESSDIY